jgi:nucleotide-binding universal stress UspA family protein
MLDKESEYTPETVDVSNTDPSVNALKIKNILVPVDFSECSLKAWKYALAFARQFGASVTACHIINSNQFGCPDWNIDYANYLVYEEKIEEKATERLNDLIANEAGTGIKIKGEVNTGQVVDEVLEMAAELDADIILISTHGYTGLKHAFLGSTAESVVRRAACPVLVVR